MANRATAVSRTQTGVGLAIYGLNDVKKALKSMAPDLRKEMDRELRSHVKPVADRAKSLVPAEPLARWNDIPARPASRPMVSTYGQRWDYQRLRWDAGDVRRGIKVRQGGKRRRGQAVRAAWRIMNSSAAGAIFELAGSGRSNHPFVHNVTAKHGRPSRLIWQAWDEVGGGVDRKMARTVQKYERELQRRVNAADDLTEMVG